MRAVLLLDETDALPQWAATALQAAVGKGLQLVLVAQCTNLSAPRITGENAAYRALAAIGLRRVPSLMPVPLASLGELPRVRFSAVDDGGGKRVPAHVASRFAEADVVIDLAPARFRGAADLPVRHGVIAYHHGHLERPGDGPPGFGELLRGEAVQRVSVLRTHDGAAEVLASAWSSVLPHSWRRTVEETYRAGAPLLAKALDAIKAGGASPRAKAPEPDPRLPGTSQVAGLAVRITRATCAHIAYGLAREKQWRVARVAVQLRPDQRNVLRGADLRPLPLPRGYAFAADPFVHGDKIYAELLNARSGLEELGAFCGGSWHTGLLPLPGRASYPHVVSDEDGSHVLPEIAALGPPLMYPLSEDGLALGEPVPLKGLEDERLLDATLFSNEEGWFLFASSLESPYRLDLWHSDDLAGPYRMHRDSPVCTDPRGARMAGSLCVLDGSLYRFGQDCAVKYGAGMRIHRVERLRRDEYAESVTGSVSIDDRWGPHTVNVLPDGLVVDYFAERTTLAAGPRRLLELFRARRAES